MNAITPQPETAEIEKAAAFVIDTGKCSTSELQRHLAIGYNRAARIIEALECAGVVTPADHIGKRDVVVNKIPEGILTVKVFTPGNMKKAHETMRRAQGKPPMKPDPSFDQAADNTYRVAANELRQFIERIGRLDAEKKDLAEQHKEVMSEAKSRGYDTKILRKVIALRKREPDDIAEEEAVMEMYKEALGM